MAAPAQDALNIATDWASRISNGAVLNDVSPQSKAFFVDLCTAVGLLAQASLGATPASVTMDPADTNNAVTTEAQSEGSV